jgi:hypothetical protein
MTLDTRFTWLATVASAAACALLSAQVYAADACDGFTWNVSHERVLFATQPVAVTAAKTAGPAPALAVDKLYEISLAPQSKVNFALAPEKKTVADGVFAGVVKLNVPAAGKYRVSISDAFWIDVIADHKIVATDDFTGAHECHAPRKIVQYELPAGNDLILQISNGDGASLRVTVTAVPE